MSFKNSFGVEESPTCFPISRSSTKGRDESTTYGSRKVDMGGTEQGFRVGGLKSEATKRVGTLQRYLKMDVKKGKSHTCFWGHNKQEVGETALIKVQHQVG